MISFIIVFLCVCVGALNTPIDVLCKGDIDDNVNAVRNHLHSLTRSELLQLAEVAVLYHCDQMQHHSADDKTSPNKSTLTCQLPHCSTPVPSPSAVSEVSRPTLPYLIQLRLQRRKSDGGVFRLACRFISVLNSRFPAFSSTLNVCQSMVATLAGKSHSHTRCVNQRLIIIMVHAICNDAICCTSPPQQRQQGQQQHKQQWWM